MNKQDVNIGHTYYYARTIPNVGIYDVCELKIRTVEEEYCVGVDKHDKHAYLLDDNTIQKSLYINRKNCLEAVHEKEKNSPKISSETEYEEY